MPFKKGQSGNPGGRGSDTLFRKNLMLSHKEAGGNQKKIRQVTNALVDKALEGDIRAIALIADRVDGRVPAASSEIQQPPEDMFEGAAAATERILKRISDENMFNDELRSEKPE